MRARSSRLIFKNSVYLAISLATKVAVYALLARSLARHDVGVLLYAIALLELALGLSSFGVPQFAIRELSGGQRDVRRFFSNLLFVRLGFALLALGAIALLVSRGLVPIEAHHADVILIVCLAALPKTVSECFDVFFAVAERFIYPAGLEALNHVLFAAGCLLLLLFRFQLRTVAIFYLAVAILVALLRVVILRAQAPFSLGELSFAACRKLLRQLAPFGALGVTMVIYLRIGELMIVWLAQDGVEQLALFKMAHLPIGILIGLLAASVMPFYGNITKLGGNAGSPPPAELSETLRTTVRYVLIVGALLVLAPTVWAEPLITLVCGAPWAPSAPLLKLMLWHAPLPALVAIFARSLQAIGQERAVAAAAAALLAAKVLLLVLLLPRYGALGLTLATVGAAIVSFVALTALAWPLLRPVRRLAAPLASLGGLVVAASVAYLSPLADELLDTLLSYAVFAGLLLVSRAVSRRDLDALRMALRG